MNHIWIGTTKIFWENKKELTMTAKEIIERIRAEVERIYDGDAPKHDQQCDWEDGYFVGIAKVLDILDTIQEPPVCEGLEEEIERYVPTSLAVKFPTTDIETIKSDIRYIARHFARWQKEQMMKEAVEGIVHPYDCEIWANLVGYGYKFKEGQKVKLIIIKED